MQKVQGWSEQGSIVVSTSGLSSTTKVQGSFPLSTITVYLHGTVTLASIFSDNNIAPTPLGNPFTANSNGTFGFYAANGHYDIVLSGLGIVSPLTISDVFINDAASAFYNAIEFGAKGNGSTNDAGALNALANTTIPAGGGTIYLPPATYLVGTNLTFPANVTLQFDQGAKLSISTGITVTIGGNISASPLAQIFSGLGTAVFPANPALGSVANVTVYPQWWGAVTDGVVDCGPAVQAAINSGARRIFCAAGEWGIGTPITITVSDFILEGASRVLTDFLPLSSDIHVGSGPNAMFVNSNNATNCIIKGIRFFSLIAFTGWVFWAEEGVKGGQCLFSSIITECWIAMGTASTGFFHGGVNDCWFDKNDIEVTGTVFDLQGAGIGLSDFTDNHMTACVGPFINCTANASAIMRVDGLYVSSHVEGFVFNITSGTNWKIDNVDFDYEGATGATIGGLANLSGMSLSLLSNFVASRGAGSMAALVLASCQIKISDGFVVAGGNSGVVNYTFNISGASDIDIDDVTISGDLASQIGLAGSGDIRIRNSRLSQGAAYIIVDSAGGPSYNLTVSHCDLLNGAVSAAVPLFFEATSGNIYYRGNTIGTTGGGTQATAYFEANGSGNFFAGDNTFLGGLNLATGSAQLIKLGDAPGLSAVYHSTGMPSSGSWIEGDIVFSMTPTEAGSASSKYIISGWIRHTTGSSNTLNTDWYQMRTLTGN